jgi:SNF family Na+-dependent transporter
MYFFFLYLLYLFIYGFFFFVKQFIVGRSTGDDKYADAMRQTLKTRGDGGSGIIVVICYYYLL